MPKMSDDTLLRYAISAAVLDRLSLADAYHGVGVVAESAKASAAQFEALSGKKLAGMSDVETEAARLCFIYAEQYEQSCVDARIDAGPRWKEDPERRAASFREVRLRRWGKTRFEVDVENSVSVSVHEFAAGIISTPNC